MPTSTIGPRHVVVQAHLEALEACLRMPINTRTAIIASISLRALVDGNILGRTAHDEGILIEIDTPVFEPKDFEVKFFVVGGFRCGGMVIEPPMNFLRFDPEDKVEEYLYRKNMRFTKYLAGNCMYLWGRGYSREHVIRFVANKCGGAHHHENDKEFGDLERAISGLGAIFYTPMFDDLSYLFAEIIGISEAIVSNEQVGKLLTTLREKEVSSSLE